MSYSKNKIVGNTGELIAKTYLESLGYLILEQNWHFSRHSEVDIIAKDKSTIVFVEVKTRTTTAFGHPLESITSSKLQKIYMAGLAYLEQSKIKHSNYRIDVVSIVGLNNPDIEHLKNVGFDN